MEYHPRFRLILHTKYFNPHYKPEVQAQCTLINFLVTREGLEDQLLAAVVAKERPDLETLKVGAWLGAAQNDPVPAPAAAQPEPRCPRRPRGLRLVLCPAGDGPSHVLSSASMLCHSTRTSAHRHLGALSGAARKGRTFD